MRAKWARVLIAVQVACTLVAVILPVILFVVSMNEIDNRIDALPTFLETCSDGTNPGRVEFSAENMAYIRNAVCKPAAGSVIEGYEKESILSGAARAQPVLRRIVERSVASRDGSVRVYLAPLDASIGGSSLRSTAQGAETFSTKSNDYKVFVPIETLRDNYDVRVSLRAFETWAGLSDTHFIDKLDFPLPLDADKTRFIQTYIVDPTDVFYNFADTYDNALSIITNVAIGEHRRAMQTAKGVLKTMRLLGYKRAPEKNDFRGLYARTLPDGSITYGSAGVLGDVTLVRDAGNNAFMGIALCKLAISLSSKNDVLIDACLTMARTIEKYFTCKPIATVNQMNTHNMERLVIGSYIYKYVGRIGSDYNSVEHNIDIFALSNLILQNPDELSLNDEDKTMLEGMRNTSKAFVNSMVGTGEDAGLFYTGTSSCVTGKINDADPRPVDAITWNALAGVLGDIDKYKKPLQRAAADLITKDTWMLDSGCVENRFANASNNLWVPCDYISEDLQVWGARFSTKGIGIQLENSGSASMAFRKFSVAFDNDATMKETSVRLVNSMKRMFRAWPDGIPASFHVQRFTANARIHNTGFTWSYFKKQHAASTYWVALSDLYADSGGDEVFNPYSPVVTKTSDDSVSFIIRGDFYDPYNAIIQCSEASSHPTSYTGCPDGLWAIPGENNYASKFGEICGFFVQYAHELANGSFFLANKFGIKEDSIKDTCKHVFSFGCTDEQSYIFLREIYKQLQGGDLQCGNSN